ncbi:MAG: hypothetical protein ACYCST_17835 [Acidimicrobiales bacterium]
MKLATSNTHNFLLHYGAIAAGGVLLMAAIGWVFSSHQVPLPAAHPAPAHAAPAAPAHAAPVHPAIIARATTAPAPTAPVALGPVELPAQPAPQGLRQGYAVRAVASSPAPATYGDRPVWTQLATAVEPAPTGSWSTAIPASLRAIAPSSGLIQTVITSYIRIATAGQHVLILSVSGGPAKAALTVDGQADSLAAVTRTCSAFGGCPQAPTTSAGSVTLAVGLHVLIVTTQTSVGDQAANLDIYMRGPGAAMPMAIVPWAVPAGAGASSATTTAKTKGVTP